MAVILLSGQASGARQQLALCYDAHFQEKIHRKEQLSALRAKLAALHERKEVSDAKLESYHELHQIQGNNTSARDGVSLLKRKCREFARRITSYEVNELLLKRRHAVLDEELQNETDRRTKAEHALSDLDATLRGRILYLELWKQGASTRVERLQAEFDDPASHDPGLIILESVLYFR